MNLRSLLKAMVLICGPILVGLALFLLLPDKVGPALRLEYSEPARIEVYVGNERLDADTVFFGRAKGSLNFALRVQSQSKEPLRDVWVSVSTPREMKERIVPRGDFDIDGFEADCALVGFRTTRPREIQPGESLSLPLLRLNAAGLGVLGVRVKVGRGRECWIAAESIFSLEKTSKC